MNAIHVHNMCKMRIMLVQWIFFLQEYEFGFTLVCSFCIHYLFRTFIISRAVKFVNAFSNLFRRLFMLLVYAACRILLDVCRLSFAACRIVIVVSCLFPGSLAACHGDDRSLFC